MPARGLEVYSVASQHYYFSLTLQVLEGFYLVGALLVRDRIANS
jgi:hypothetical protein